MKLIKTIKKFLRNTSQTARMSEVIAHQTAMTNLKLTELIERVKHQTKLINKKFNLEEGDFELDVKTMADGFQAPPGSSQTFKDVLQTHPLMFAHKTYNTNHPDYNPAIARNFPGKIFNMEKDPGNRVYNELKKLIHNKMIAEDRWQKILKETLAEAKTVPHADQVFERIKFIEKYLAELEARYGGYYQPGWVNLDDAIFLYWVVRRLQPKVIVQAGVCNGLSSAFMMLALAKNGPEGTLHVVDLPPIFDSNDDAWKVRGKVYGVVIPEGKSSGWLVPDAYRNRFEVLNGDAKLLLPGLLKRLGKIDMFYHDSDHTYDHMMFEFKEAKTYLTPSGVIVSDDISWNASLWDFADEYKVPAYNYRGSMGIACF